jgi:hypothetical protein
MDYRNLSTEEKEKHKYDDDLRFPSSDSFVRGNEALWEQGGMQEESMALFVKGAESGCVSSMNNCTSCLTNEGKFHRAIAWALEAAIRGGRGGIMILNDCYAIPNSIKLQKVNALSMYWTRILYERGPEAVSIQAADRFEDDIGKKCFECGKKDSKKSVILKACSMCNFYFYCSEKCQLNHWKQGKHIGECRQLFLLNKYHKPYAKEFRDKIIRGDDPKLIKELQTLRRKLGLTRPRDEYDGESLFKNRPKFLLFAARNDGTVWCGSIPKVI